MPFLKNCFKLKKRVSKRKEITLTSVSTEKFSDVSTGEMESLNLAENDYIDENVNNMTSSDKEETNESEDDQELEKLEDDPEMLDFIKKLTDKDRNDEQKTESAAAKPIVPDGDNNSFQKGVCEVTKESSASEISNDLNSQKEQQRHSSNANVDLVYDSLIMDISDESQWSLTEKAPPVNGIERKNINSDIAVNLGISFSVKKSSKNDVNANDEKVASVLEITACYPNSQLDRKSYTKVIAVRKKSSETLHVQDDSCLSVKNKNEPSNQVINKSEVDVRFKKIPDPYFDIYVPTGIYDESCGSFGNTKGISSHVDVKKCVSLSKADAKCNETSLMRKGLIKIPTTSKFSKKNNEDPANFNSKNSNAKRIGKISVLKLKNIQKEIKQRPRREFINRYQTLKKSAHVNNLPRSRLVRDRVLPAPEEAIHVHSCSLQDDDEQSPREDDVTKQVDQEPKCQTIPIIRRCGRRSRIELVCPECMFRKNFERRRIPPRLLKHKQEPPIPIGKRESATGTPPFDFDGSDKYALRPSPGKEKFLDLYTRYPERHTPKLAKLSSPPGRSPKRPLYGTASIDRVKSVVQTCDQKLFLLDSRAQTLEGGPPGSSHQTPRVPAVGRVKGPLRPVDSAKRAASMNLRKRFDVAFERYAKNGRGAGDLISCKGSSQWMMDVGVVDLYLTEKEAEETFKFCAGMKIMLNRRDYKRFLGTITRRKKLQYNEIYRVMANHASATE